MMLFLNHLNKLLNGKRCGNVLSPLTVKQVDCVSSSKCKEK